MIDAPIALAFTAGMVATVNPCGFAMLPAYLGYFLGLDPAGSNPAGGDPTGDDPAARPSTTTSLLRALAVGAAVSAGFLGLFALAGILVSSTSLAVGEISPWFTVVIGAVLLAAGIGFALGWTPKILLPRLDKGGRDRTLWSMALFGLSYAIASLSCTLPVFTQVVVNSFSRDSFAGGVATFVAYGLGMSMLLVVLTLTLALARQGMVTALRRTLPHIQRVSGVIMALMGTYLVWWGIYEIRILRSGGAVSNGPVQIMSDWSNSLAGSLTDLDPLQAALVLGLIIATVVLLALLRAERRSRQSTEELRTPSG